MTYVMTMNRKLSIPTFIVTQILILALSLSFLAGLYYLLNIQYQQPKNRFLQGGPVTTPPSSLVLEVTQPDDNVLVFQPSLIVSGSTSNGNLVLISSAASDLVITPKSDGSYSTVVNLIEGVNNLNIVAFDKTGDQRSQTKTVYYSKEKI